MTRQQARGERRIEQVVTADGAERDALVGELTAAPHGYLAPVLGEDERA
ncbi:hypothetical protein [Jiangella asiatica]|nr:hypothetical protein [Jiangella asiatica]